MIYLYKKMKKKVLIIFKYPRGHWNSPIINKFSNYYDTEYLYISDYKNKNFTEIVNDLNNSIKTKNIEVVVFDVDYFKFINFFFIKNISCKKKILISGDDFELHEMNSITASACDLVLTQDPLSVLKYREKGYEAHAIDFENGKINKNNNKKKEIDVLFFGALSPERKEFLKYITNEGISLKNVGHEEGADFLPENELLKLISKSKIILNLSKSRSDSVKNFSSGPIYSFYYQFKGRIIIAGLNGTVCVSEYSPGQEMVFTEDEIPTFFKKEECLKILKKLLSDEDLLKQYTNKFSLKVENLYEDKKNFESVYKAIEKLDHRKVNLLKFPYWYLRIASKQIIVRNIKLSNLIKTISQFKVIMKIVKDSNLLIKLLILFETVINSLWYSFIFTIKPKK